MLDREAVVLTTIARVKDWRELGRLNRELLLATAREVGATRYRLYRNMKDASQMLMVAELPGPEALDDLSREVAEQLGAALQGGVSDDRVWESTELDGIG